MTYSHTHTHTHSQHIETSSAPDNADGQQEFIVRKRFGVKLADQGKYTGNGAHQETKIGE
jgi:hypothetical protein